MAPKPRAVTWGPCLPSWRVGSLGGVKRRGVVGSAALSMVECCGKEKQDGMKNWRQGKGEEMAALIHILSKAHRAAFRTTFGRGTEAQRHRQPFQLPLRPSCWRECRSRGLRLIGNNSGHRLWCTEFGFHVRVVKESLRMYLEGYPPRRNVEVRSRVHTNSAGERSSDRHRPHFKTPSDAGMRLFSDQA